MTQASVRETAEIVTLPITHIRPSAFQTRVSLEDIDSLCRSIDTIGLLNPILVRRVSSKDYEVISGHRRMEACKRLGVAEVPCNIRIANDKEAYVLSLAENLERESLDPVEEAEAFKRFVCEYGWGSISELASRIGRSEEYVSQRILMLNLPPSILEKIRRRTLSQSHAEELVWIKNSQLQTELSEQIVKKHLSVSQTHDIAKLVKKGFDLRQAISSAHTEVSAPDFAKFNSQKRDKNSSRIKRALVSLRTSLSVLDLIIEEMVEDDDLESAKIQKSIRRARYNLHQIIDDIVKEKVGIERKTR
jgi:ParB family transcriptional regulator, chromosome partitioning protein